MNSNDPQKPVDDDQKDSEKSKAKGEGGCQHSHRHRMWKVPFIFAAIVLVKSAIILLLWNSLVPDLFHGPALNYLQSIELTILAKLLVGFGFRGFGGGHRAHFAWKRRWATLSSEEREKLREHLRHRCHH